VLVCSGTALPLSAYAIGPLESSCLQSLKPHVYTFTLLFFRLNCEEPETMVPERDLQLDLAAATEQGGRERRLGGREKRDVE
jgi:hypothetical protein